MARKVYMDEATIQKMEHWDATQIVCTVFKGEGGVQRAAEDFVCLLRSYRIAANVAVSAWRLVEDLQKTGQINPTLLAELRQRLHLFAPEAPAFAPARPVREYTCRVLEELYNHLSRWDFPTYGPGTLMEQLYNRIDALRRALAAGEADGAGTALENTRRTYDSDSPDG